MEAKYRYYPPHYSLTLYNMVWSDESHRLAILTVMGSLKAGYSAGPEDPKKPDGAIRITIDTDTFNNEIINGVLGARGLKRTP